MPYRKEVREVQELLARLDDIDLLFTEDRRHRDLAEKLAAAADETAGAAAGQAADNRRRIRWLWVAGLLVALLWTPATAYGAVWIHERVRNYCYPGVVYVGGPPPVAEPWYCGMFPGTGHAGSPQQHN